MRRTLLICFLCAMQWSELAISETHHLIEKRKMPLVIPKQSIWRYLANGFLPWDVPGDVNNVGNFLNNNTITVQQNPRQNRKGTVKSTIAHTGKDPFRIKTSRASKPKASVAATKIPSIVPVRPGLVVRAHNIHQIRTKPTSTPRVPTTSITLPPHSFSRSPKFPMFLMPKKRKIKKRSILKNLFGPGHSAPSSTVSPRADRHLLLTILDTLQDIRVQVDNLNFVAKVPRRKSLSTFPPYTTGRPFPGEYRGFSPVMPQQTQVRPPNMMVQRPSARGINIPQTDRNGQKISKRSSNEQRKMFANRGTTEKILIRVTRSPPGKLNPDIIYNHPKLGRHNAHFNQDEQQRGEQQKNKRQHHRQPGVTVPTTSLPSAHPEITTRTLQQTKGQESKKLTQVVRKLKHSNKVKERFKNKLINKLIKNLAKKHKSKHHSHTVANPLLPAIQRSIGSLHVLNKKMRESLNKLTTDETAHFNIASSDIRATGDGLEKLRQEIREKIDGIQSKISLLITSQEEMKRILNTTFVSLMASLKCVITAIESAPSATTIPNLPKSTVNTLSIVPTSGKDIIMPSSSVRKTSRNTHKKLFRHRLHHKRRKPDRRRRSYPYQMQDSLADPQYSVPSYPDMSGYPNYQRPIPQQPVLQAYPGPYNVPYGGIPPGMGGVPPFVVNPVVPVNPQPAFLPPPAVINQPVPVTQSTPTNAPVVQIVNAATAAPEITATTKAPLKTTKKGTTKKPAARKKPKRRRRLVLSDNLRKVKRSKELDRKRFTAANLSRTLNEMRSSKKRRSRALSKREYSKVKRSMGLDKMRSSKAQRLRAQNKKRPSKRNILRSQYKKRSKRAKLSLVLDKKISSKTKRSRSQNKNRSNTAKRSLVVGKQRSSKAQILRALNKKRSNKAKRSLILNKSRSSEAQRFLRAVDKNRPSKIKRSRAIKKNRLSKVLQSLTLTKRRYSKAKRAAVLDRHQKSAKVKRSKTPNKRRSSEAKISKVLDKARSSSAGRSVVLDKTIYRVKLPTTLNEKIFEQIKLDTHSRSPSSVKTKAKVASSKRTKRRSSIQNRFREHRYHKKYMQKNIIFKPHMTRKGRIVQKVFVIRGRGTPVSVKNARPQLYHHLDNRKSLVEPMIRRLVGGPPESGVHSQAESHAKRVANYERLYQKYTPYIPSKKKFNLRTKNKRTPTKDKSKKDISKYMSRMPSNYAKKLLSQHKQNNLSKYKLSLTY